MISYCDADFDVEADMNAVEGVLARYAQLSDAVFHELSSVKDVPYGAHPKQRLDIFAPATEAHGTIIFFHGGWWRAGTKEARAFLAPAVVDAGFAFVSVEYPLAPAAKLAELVASAEQALAWVHTNIDRHGGRASSLVVCGNSAGAHLAACAASLESLQRIGVPAGAVQRLVCLSGLYDLTPLAPLFPNTWIDFSDELIATCSPQRLSYGHGLKVELYVGANEPRGFLDQTDAFARSLKARGHDVLCGLVRDEDHFSIIARLPEIILGSPDKISIIY